MTELKRIRVMLAQLGYFPHTLRLKEDGSFCLSFDCPPPANRLEIEKRFSCIGFQCTGFAISRNKGWCVSLKEKAMTADVG